MTYPITTQPPLSQLAASGRHTLWAIDSPLRDDIIMGTRVVTDPASGRELACLSLSNNGMLLIDPGTRAVRHVPAQSPTGGSAWMVAQSPRGDLYQVDLSRKEPLIRHWDFNAPHTRVIGRSPAPTCFSIEAGADGQLFLPSYSDNTLHLFDTRSGQSRVLANLDPIGHHVRQLFRGPDGMLYAITLGYDDQPRKGHFLVMIDPDSGKVTDLTHLLQSPQRGFQLQRAGDQRLYVGQNQFGRKIWRELIHGQLHDANQSAVRLTHDGSPLAFQDGSYIQGIEPWRCTLIDADGKPHELDLTHDFAPARLFSLCADERRVWLGSFIPLRLGCYTQATNIATNLGNPTPVTGEIYAQTVAKGKLFFGSYTDAWITRYDPDKPLSSAPGVHMNPTNLGRMKDDRLPLHRVYGVTQDPQQNVYFSALGGYGCPDSGITRVDVDSERLTRWIYPDTTFGPILFLPTGQLLVSERRRSEPAIRLTAIDPNTGAASWSHRLLEDEGHITSMILTPGGDSVICVHAYRATFLRFDLSARQITHRAAELRLGEHCHNALIAGPDGRLWAYTNRSLFSIGWDLADPTPIFQDWPQASANAYRFGICVGPDGAIYFPDGHRLLRVTTEP